VGVRRQKSGRRSGDEVSQKLNQNVTLLYEFKCYWWHLVIVITSSIIISTTPTIQEERTHITNFHGSKKINSIKIKTAGNKKKIWKMK